MSRTPYRVMGAFSGMFYETTSGAKVFLAHRKRSQMHKFSWLLDVRVLDQCRAQGITAVGVVWKEAGAKRIHLTHIDDFFGPHSFFHFGDTKQRGLPLKQFRIDPAKSAKVIASAVRLR